MNTDTAPNLATLENILSAVRQSQYPGLAEVMTEAVTICQSRHGVHAGVNLHLRAALTSISAGWSDEATRFIEIALDIEDRWVGDATQEPESTGEIPQLGTPAASENRSRTPRGSALRLIAATLLILPVGVVMLAAGTVALALTVAMWPFAYVRNHASALLAALLRELYRPL
jgi:hypothetical protein